MDGWMHRFLRKFRSTEIQADSGKPTFPNPLPIGGVYNAQTKRYSADSDTLKLTHAVVALVTSYGKRTPTGWSARVPTPTKEVCGEISINLELGRPEGPILEVNVTQRTAEQNDLFDSCMGWEIENQDRGDS